MKRRKKTGPAIDRFSSRLGSPQKMYSSFISSDVFERIPKKQTCRSYACNLTKY